MDQELVRPQQSSIQSNEETQTGVRTTGQPTAVVHSSGGEFLLSIIGGRQFVFAWAIVAGALAAAVVTPTFHVRRLWVFLINASLVWLFLHRSLNQLFGRVPEE